MVQERGAWHAHSSGWLLVRLGFASVSGAPQVLSRLFLYHPRLSLRAEGHVIPDGTCVQQRVIRGGSWYTHEIYTTNGYGVGNYENVGYRGLVLRFVRRVL